jgi:hypothetical protein
MCQKVHGMLGDFVRHLLPFFYTNNGDNSLSSLMDNYLIPTLHPRLYGPIVTLMLKYKTLAKKESSGMGSGKSRQLSSSTI